MSSDLKDLIEKVARLEERLGNMFRFGTVDEVKDDKLRMKWAEKGADGKPLLGPWINTGNQRGGSRERRYYKKGQSLVSLNVSGDPAHGLLLPYAPNDSFKAPAHAGKDDDTRQIDDMRMRDNAKGSTFWLEAEKKQQQGGATGGGTTGGSTGGGTTGGGTTRAARPAVRLLRTRCAPSCEIHRLWRLHWTRHQEKPSRCDQRRREDKSR